MGHRKDDRHYMASVKLGPKGQIVIPKEVRAMFGLEPGDTLVLLADKKRMREAIPPLLTAQLPETPDDPEERLCTCLALSEIANYLRRLCESMIDDIPQQTEGD